MTIKNIITKKLIFVAFSSLLLFVGCGGGSTTTPSTSSQNQAASINTTFTTLFLNENSQTTNYDLNISDNDGDDLNITVESNNSSILSVVGNWTNPVLQATYTASTLDFNLSTEVNATGIVQITINVNDGEVNTNKTFNININSLFQSGNTWKGDVYNTVESNVTNKIWLDRNLGATRLCTSATDLSCYGDYYQWGRNVDGHELNTSTNNTNTYTNINDSNNSSFILSDSNYGNDWVKNDASGTLRGARWSSYNGTSICPIGFRVPTKIELDSENLTNIVIAYSSFLKLPYSGIRNSDDANISNQGNFIYTWTSNYEVFNGGDRIATHFKIQAGNFQYPKQSRAHAMSVRCIKN